MTSRELDTSTEVSGPHAFAIRERAPSSEAPPASIASSPASVTIAIRPFVGWTAVDMQVICVRRQEEILKIGNLAQALGWAAGLLFGPPDGLFKFSGPAHNLKIARLNPVPTRLHRFLVVPCATHSAVRRPLRAHSKFSAN
jgi:hypothetical protein